MKVKFIVSAILFLINCDAINSQTPDRDLTNNNFSNENFFWKSVVPFYVQEVLQKINTTEDYEEILFNKVSRSCVLDATEWIARLLQLNPVVDSWGFRRKSISNSNINQHSVTAITNYNIESKSAYRHYRCEGLVK